MKKTLILLLVFASFTSKTNACTTAVISGKYTPDGRPIIWKVRDSDYFKNKMMYFEDGKYSYTGLVNSEDLKGEQIWGGSNSAGFAIMNSASYNVNLGDTSSLKDREGYFMKLALQKCATLQDFEELLKKHKKPMGLAAHFGVIDANGGAAFYEVNNYTFTKFDANEPAQAPNGYILRTNFSFTGKKDEGYGFIRFQIAQDIFYHADAKKQIDYKTIISNFSRCFIHPVLKRNYREEFKSIPSGENFVNSDDLITRYGTSSAILIHGVKNNEPADLTTIWTLVGYPNTCIAMPVWVREGNNMPKLLLANNSGNAPLNEMSLKLKDTCYPIGRSDGSGYLLISKLFNLENNGIIQRIEGIEAEIFKQTEEKLNNWRKNYVKGEISTYSRLLDNKVSKFYNDEFNLSEPF